MDQVLDDSLHADLDAGDLPHFRHFYVVEGLRATQPKSRHRVCRETLTTSYHLGHHAHCCGRPTGCHNLAQAQGSAVPHLLRAVEYYRPVHDPS